MKVPKRWFELRAMSNEAMTAMLNKIDVKNDMEYGFVMGQIQLNIAHAISKLLPYEEEVEEVKNDNYETVGISLLVGFLEANENFKLIPDTREYVIECKLHGLVSTGLNVAEVIQDLANHQKDCVKEEEEVKEMDTETSIREIEEYNLKWLEYMNNADITKISTCPDGHQLVVYPAVDTLGNPTSERVICCPESWCSYYDYNTFKVSEEQEISSKIKRLSK